MEEFFNKIIDLLINTFSSLGPLFGIFIIILESILPFLPLAAFFSLNSIVFGPYIGFIINLIATILGCLLSYSIFKFGFSNKLYKKTKIDGKTQLFLKNINKMSFPNLVLLLAMPFTPAFAVNIAAGLSKMNLKKFILALILGKPFLIYFWSYIGKTLIQSITDGSVILKISGMLVLAYILSRLVQKKIKIEE